MNKRIFLSSVTDEYIGCPFPFCRQKVCSTKEMSNLFEHGIIIDPMCGFFVGDDNLLRCFNCSQNIGNIIDRFAYLECNFYQKQVIFPHSFEKIPSNFVLFTQLYEFADEETGQHYFQGVLTGRKIVK